MRRKIFLYLIAVFGLFSIGAGISTRLISHTTGELNHLVQLHEVEDLRQDLLIALQAIQEDIYTAGSLFGRQASDVKAALADLTRQAAACGSCHHPSPLAEELKSLADETGRFALAFDRALGAGTGIREPNPERVSLASRGRDIIKQVGTMSLIASNKLNDATSHVMDEGRKAQAVLYVTLVMAFVLAAGIALRLSGFVTIPIEKLLEGTRMIRDGRPGFLLDYRDQTEFGQLAEDFNAMSLSLKESYEEIQREIEERHSTEISLRRSEEFLSTMFHSIRDPFCIIDDTYTIVRANQAYAEMKRTTVEALLGRRCHEVLYDRREVCDSCVVRPTFASGDSCAKEKAVVNADGMMAWSEIYTYPVLDDEGTVSHVIEYTRDVTERKKAEAALRESRERYALAARGANDGLWDWNLLKDRIYFSPRWKTMLGYSEKEIGTDPDEWFSRVHPDDRERVRSECEAHLRGTSDHFESEYRIMSRDRGYRWVLSRGLAVRPAGGTASRMAGSQTDITERKLAEEQLIHDAFHDHLTGLPNRALFVDRVRHAIKRAKRRGDFSFAVLFVDLDRFKIVNDSLGHPVGDKLLVEAARRLQRCIRPDDTVARFGGDEFTLLLEEAGGTEGANLIADRLCAELAEPFSIEGHEIFVTASVGITLGSPAVDLPEHYLRDADIAMYHAKAAGKARPKVFTEEMRSSAMTRLQTETELRQAVEKKQWVLHYQPIVSIVTMNVTGFEALLRWEHPVRGMIYPNNFIYIAEETGLIGRIGDWVLKEACTQARQWQLHYPNSNFSVSVNISAKQFTTKLADKVRQTLEDTGLDPGRLRLEITESMLIENREFTSQLLRDLRALGVEVHLDDFGTGYSSLSYLNELPINALKIDRSFVRAMEDESDTAEIVNAVVDLGKRLGLDIVVEGIETTAQLGHFRSLECDYLQGFLVSKPMEAASVNRMLDEIESRRTANGKA